MIDGLLAQRILEDARIALDALEGIRHVIERDGFISVDYLMEKANTARQCIGFMKGVADDDR